MDVVGFAFETKPLKSTLVEMLKPAAWTNACLLPNNDAEALNKSGLLLEHLLGFTWFQSSLTEGARAVVPGCPGAFSSSIQDFQKHASNFPKLLSSRSLKQNLMYLFVKKTVKRKSKRKDTHEQEPKAQILAKTSPNFSPSLPWLLSLTVVIVQ